MDLEDSQSSSNDPKYKQFNDELNNVLQQFTKSTEWADFIKCLGKFAKVFEKYPKSTSIQSKLMISKRLSQCLNPSLPSGCHSKALDTYELIFHRIGQDKLAKDIAIYATGLFPLFHLAATDIRFKIITLYEKYILPLNYRLHSCLNGVVSSLLPGLEEGQGEVYDAVDKLLEQFCRSTSTILFYQAIWKSLITTPYNRQSAINYLLAHLPKDFTDDSNQVIYLPEKDTLVSQALSDCLVDSTILVQRNILELITSYFPLSTRVFSAEALETIIRSALKVVTSKDMSLNRRLYSWLLGPQEKQQAFANLDYFLKYAKDSTVLAFLNLFNSIYENISPLHQNNNSNNPTAISNNHIVSSQDILVPFKILIYLFQKEEFQIILNDIFLEILKCLYSFREGYVFSKDIVRYIDDLLDCISDHTVVWNYLANMLTFNGSTVIDGRFVENIKLVECFLDIIPLSVEDVQTKHLPSLLLAMIKSLKSGNLLNRYNQQQQQQQLQQQIMIQYTQLSLKLIGKIIVDTSQHQISLVESIEDYQDYFIQLCQYLSEMITNIQPTFQSMVPINPISLIPNNTNINTLSNPLTFTPISSYSFITSSDLFVILDLSLQVLVGLFQQFKTSPASPVSSPQLDSSMPKWFNPIYNFCMSENPFISCLAIKSFISLTNKHGDSNLSRSFRNIITNTHFTELSKKLWSLLDPNNCAVHYKVATLFLQLREMNESACSGVIAEAMLEQNINSRIEGYQRFALFWRLTGELGSSALPFSNTLFLMLDSLNDEQPIIRLTGHTWLADSISKAERILDPLLKILLDKSTIRFNNIYQSIYDARRVIYAFKILKAIIECDFKLFIQHVIEKPISKDVLQLNEAQTLSFRESPNGPNATNSFITKQDHLNNQLGYGLTFNTTDHQQNSSNTSPTTTTETSSDFLFIPTNSYIDLLVVVALRFIQGQIPTTIDRSSREGESFITQNDVVQICAAEFLQYLLVQTSIQPSKALEIANYIQDPILQNLAQAVSSCNMVLQVHLLALLRSIVLIDSNNNHLQQQLQQLQQLQLQQQQQQQLNNQNPLSPSQQQSQQQFQDPNNNIGNTSLTSITQTPMFLQTTVVGLIQPSTRFNIRFYWLDFITFCLPRMVNSPQLPNVVITIINCLRDLLSSFDNRSLYDSLTSRDIIILLKSLTFILKITVLEPLTSFDKINQEDQQNNTRGGVRSLTDFVKDVFTSEIDQSTSLTPVGLVRDELFNDLPSTIIPLLRIWGPPKNSNSKISISTDVSSDTHNKFAIQDLIIHIFDPLLLKYPTQFIGSLLDIWQKTIDQSNSLEAQNTRRVIVEILFSLESLKEDVLFNSLYQILSSLHQQERNKPPKPMIHKITMKESALYDFAYRYIEEYSMQFDMISTQFLSIVRESLHSSNPMTFVSQLQILNAYIRKTLPEEKAKNPIKYRLNKRDLQDLLPKIIEACFMISGKSFNDISAMYIPPLSNDNQQQQQQQQQSSLSSSSTSRPTSIDLKSLQDQMVYTFTSTSISDDSQQQSTQSSQQSQQQSSLTTSQQQQSPLTISQQQQQSSLTTSQGQSRIRSSSGGENSLSSSSSGGELKKDATKLKTQVSLKSLVHLSNILGALLDAIFDDKERINTLLTNSLHNVVPYLKTKGDINRENTFYALCLFSSLSEYSYNIKSIKKDVLELFFDFDFFKSDIKSLEQTSKVINQIMIHDKTALSDFMKIIGKPWTPPSALTFINKDTENMNRAKQLKRLSFILWSGSENQYLSILPNIQEKVVESLRIPNATILHLHVFLLLRVLLLRISHQNLRSFWPIILTELIDILAHGDNPELILASCKFLDLALTLPSITEQFSLFEWVYLKDCFIKQQEAPFKPLVDKISQNPVEFNITIPTLTSSGIVECSDPNRLLRPSIMIRSINDLPNGFSDFKLFLTRFSSCIYKRHLTNNRVDYQFINEHLCFDFCEMEINKLNNLIHSMSISDFGSILNTIHEQKRNTGSSHQQSPLPSIIEQPSPDIPSPTSWTRSSKNLVTSTQSKPQLPFLERSRTPTPPLEGENIISPTSLIHDVDNTTTSANNNIEVDNNNNEQQQQTETNN